MAPSGPQPLTPTALRKEGPDRLAIEWNDGHRSVYTWRHLREHCPCAGCREEKVQPPTLTTTPPRTSTPATSNVGSTLSTVKSPVSPAAESSPTRRSNT